MEVFLWGGEDNLPEGSYSEAVCTVQDVGWVMNNVTGFGTICSSWTDMRDFVGGGLVF